MQREHVSTRRKTFSVLIAHFLWNPLGVPRSHLKGYVYAAQLRKHIGKIFFQDYAIS